MTFWYIKHLNDMCKYRKKGNKGYICEHNRNPLITCNEKHCPLKSKSD